MCQLFIAFAKYNPTGTPKIDAMENADMTMPINEKLVVELYSK